MSWRFARVVGALVALCSVGIVLSGAAVDAATAHPAIASVIPIKPALLRRTWEQSMDPRHLDPRQCNGRRTTSARHRTRCSRSSPGIHRQHELGRLDSQRHDLYRRLGRLDCPVGRFIPISRVFLRVGRHRRGTHSDLIQTGTSQDTPSTSTSSPYFAWFELLPDSAVEINAPVAPGDKMLASITEGSPGSWTISIEDQTQSWIYTNTFSYSISAQTAEWIEEAPTVGGSLSTLADFGSSTFSSLGVSGEDTSAVGMTDVDMTNPAGTIIAYPTSIVSSSFSALYGTPQPSVTSVTPASGTYRWGYHSHDPGQLPLWRDCSHIRWGEGWWLHEC